MKIAEKVLNLLEQIVLDEPYPLDQVRDSFQKLVNKYFTDISVVDVERDVDLISVTFLDTDDGAQLDAVFGMDDEGAFCYVVDPDEPEGDEGVEIDLDPLDPPIYTDPLGITLPDLTSVDQWMNKTTITAILAAGGAKPSAEIPGTEKAEAYKWVIRGGKKTRIPIIRHHKPLSPARRRALQKARMKAHTSQAQRHRSLSLKIRNRLHL